MQVGSAYKLQGLVAVDTRNVKIRQDDVEFPAEEGLFECGAIPGQRNLRIQAGTAQLLANQAGIGRIVLQVQNGNCGSHGGSCSN